MTIYILIFLVALLVSAWIETLDLKVVKSLDIVALLVSAWIETISIAICAVWSCVALLVSAWIETGSQAVSFNGSNRSHSS